MSCLNNFRNKKEREKENKTPSNLLKNGIDSIILLFENKNNEYHKKISEYQIIINNLQIKNKKLIKENYILKKNNTHQNKLIKDLRNENNELKNIINNIEGKLSMDLSHTNINNKKSNNNNNKRNDINNRNKNNSNLNMINNKSFNSKMINKLNINNYGDSNRTRNMSNFSGHISSSSYKEAFLTERFHKKNNVLSNNINNRKTEFNTNKSLYSNKKLEKNNSYFNDNFLNIKDNYYSRQRTKNNSFNQHYFSQEMNSKKNLTENKKDVKNRIKFIGREDSNLRTLNNLSCSKNLFDNYINDSRNVQIYNTIELY